MSNWSVFNLVFLIFLSVQAQQKDKELAVANTQFKEKQYVQAEYNYRKSQAKQPLKSVSAYNLGNTLYTMKHESEAKYAYAKAIETVADKSERHKVLHNIGNVFMKEKKYAEAVDAYKNALRNNPHDEETRYNYALAKKMLKENPPKNDKENKDKKDDKDENKKESPQNKKQDNPNDKKDNQNQDNKDNQEPPKKGEDKPQEGKFSKQRMESLLEAVNNEEKKVQEKMNLQKVKAKPVKQEKDW
jgi:tetratricopeptide (TPR) repeat protein